uniref:Uncharacterized protein n=1 Tax=Micrurus carvalhoi TaxID=3147026 RepID=A0A2H6N2D6_9SAUR
MEFSINLKFMKISSRPYLIWAKLPCRSKSICRINQDLCLHFILYKKKKVPLCFILPPFIEAIVLKNPFPYNSSTDNSCLCCKQKKDLFANIALVKIKKRTICITYFMPDSR